MQELRSYLVKIHGQVKQEHFNTTSPYRISDVRAGSEATLFTIYADQAGLVGLVRHLHQQGYVILSIRRKR